MKFGEARRSGCCIYCRASPARFALRARADINSGSFTETTSPEMQLHWVIENAKAIRAVDGVTSLVVSLRDAKRRYNAAV